MRGSLAVTAGIFADTEVPESRCNRLRKGCRCARQTPRCSLRSFEPLHSLRSVRWQMILRVASLRRRRPSSCCAFSCNTSRRSVPRSRHNPQAIESPTSSCGCHHGSSHFPPSSGHVARGHRQWVCFGDVAETDFRTQILLRCRLQPRSE